jgi:hypothetical protein
MSANRDILLKFISQQGYKKDSPDKNRPMNVILSNRITMKDVEFPVRGKGMPSGKEKVMYPGEEHSFPDDDYVIEVPEGHHRMPDGSIMADADHQYQGGGGTEENVIYVDDENDPAYRDYLIRQALYERSLEDAEIEKQYLKEGHQYKVREYPQGLLQGFYGDAQTNIDSCPGCAGDTPKIYNRYAYSNASSSNKNIAGMNIYDPDHLSFSELGKKYGVTSKMFSVNDNERHFLYSAPKPETEVKLKPKGVIETPTQQNVQRTLVTPTQGSTTEWKTLPDGTRYPVKRAATRNINTPYVDERKGDDELYDPSVGSIKTLQDGGISHADSLTLHNNSIKMKQIVDEYRFDDADFFDFAFEDPEYLRLAEESNAILLDTDIEPESVIKFPTGFLNIYAKPSRDMSMPRSLPTKPLEQLPTEADNRTVIPMPEEDMTGKVRSPQSVAIQKFLPDGTPYTVQRPVKPEHLKSQKIGFYQDAGIVKPGDYIVLPGDPRLQSYSDSLAAYNESRNLANIWEKSDLEYFNKNYADNKGVITRSVLKPGDKLKYATHHDKNSGKKVPAWENLSHGVKPHRIGRSVLKHPDGRTVSNLGIDAVVEYPIYKKPKQAFFKEGSDKAEIAKKQIELKNQGLYTGNIDGIWGSKSETAWQEYQALQEPTNDVVDPVTTGTPQPTENNTQVSEEKVVESVAETPTQDYNPNIVREIKYRQEWVQDDGVLGGHWEKVPVVIEHDVTPGYERYPDSNKGLQQRQDGGRSKKEHLQYISDPDTKPKYAHKLPEHNWTDTQDPENPFINYRVQKPQLLKKPVITKYDDDSEEYSFVEKGTDEYKDVFNRSKEGLKQDRLQTRTRNILEDGYGNKEYTPSQRVLDRVAFQKAHWGEDKMGDTDVIENMIREEIYGDAGTIDSPKEARKATRYNQSAFDISKSLLYPDEKKQDGGASEFIAAQSDTVFGTPKAQISDEEFTQWKNDFSNWSGQSLEHIPDNAYITQNTWDEYKTSGIFGPWEADLETPLKQDKAVPESSVESEPVQDVVRSVNKKPEHEFDTPPSGMSYWRDANTGAILNPDEYGFAEGNISRQFDQPYNQIAARNKYQKEHPVYRFQDGGGFNAESYMDPGDVELSYTTEGPITSRFDPRYSDYKDIANQNYVAKKALKKYDDSWKYASTLPTEADSAAYIRSTPHQDILGVLQGDASDFYYPRPKELWKEGIVYVDSKGKAVSQTFLPDKFKGKENPYTVEIGETPWGADREKEDEFRAWVNHYFPEYASKNQVDLHAGKNLDNEYIRSAYSDLGQYYMAKPPVEKDIPVEPEPAVEEAPASTDDGYEPTIVKETKYRQEWVATPNGPISGYWKKVPYTVEHDLTPGHVRYPNKKKQGGMIDPTEVSNEEMKLHKRFKKGGLTYDSTKAIYETKKLLSLLT